MSKDYDQISRDKIRNDIHSNFFVEAGAGSGKTSVLVDRMVAMVEGGMDISKICAITFTKAAAGEFYARFQKKLAKSSSARAQEALRDIDLCFMGTIDSFCNMVLSEHPATARIPSNAMITDGAQMNALYKREYSRILKGELGDDKLKEKAKRFAGCYYNAGDIFTKGMSVLSAVKNAHFNYVAPPEGTPDEVFKEKKERLVEVLTFLKNNPYILESEKSKDSTAAYNALFENYGVITGSWNDSIDNAIRSLKALKSLRVKAVYEKELDKLGPGWERFITPHISREKVAWYEINPEGDPLMIETLGNFKFSIAMDFIADCVDIISDVLRAEGRLTFNDYLLYLRDLLAEDAAKGGKLISHIYNRHSYFLIDEFQDTNPLQAEVFFYLTAENPVPDWKKCNPRPGSLFIVGDPKQSIYRFRNADVASFLRVRQLFDEGSFGEVLYMTRNFRSSDNMCIWFNKVFRDLLPEDTEIQSKFQLIPTGEKPDYKASLEGAFKYDIAYIKSIDKSEDPAEVAGIIQKIVNDPEITVQGREKEDEPRRVQYQDIMLITPGKKHMSAYMKAFTEAGIPFRIEGKVLFNECPALRSIAYMMTAVADPFDAKSIFAASHLSGCEFGDAKIHDYAERTRAFAPAALFQTLLDEERVFARVGAENAEYVYFALELLRSAETDGTVSSLKEGAAYISELVNQDSSEERCIQLSREANRVHIANLHKVKGLEAPVVILADPALKDRDADNRVDYSSNPPQSYIFKLDSSNKTTDYANEAKAELEVLQSETLRLLYVAATRASNALIVASSLTTKGEQSSGNPWSLFLNYIEEDIDDKLKDSPLPAPKTPRVLDADLLYDQAEAESVLNTGKPAKESYSLRKPSTIILKGITSSEDDYEDKSADEIKEVKHIRNAALMGTMVHKMMETIIMSGNKAKRDVMINEIIKEYEADARIYMDSLKSVYDAIQNGGFGQSNNVPQDILNELLKADEVHCELPFCYRKNDEIWHGIMDVVYKKGDKWHIVDYKTNVDADDLDEKYQEQLMAYISAFKEMTGEDADAMTYHIETQSI